MSRTMPFRAVSCAIATQERTSISASTGPSRLRLIPACKSPMLRVAMNTVRGARVSGPTLKKKAGQ